MISKFKEEVDPPKPKLTIQPKPGREFRRVDDDGVGEKINPKRPRIQHPETVSGNPDKLYWLECDNRVRVPTLFTLIEVTQKFKCFSLMNLSFVANSKLSYQLLN